MKKLLLIVSLVAATSFTAFAQKPVAGAKGFTFGIDGINAIKVGGANQTGQGTLLFRYYIADGLAARVGIGYSRTGATTDVDNTLTTGETISTKTTSGGQFGITLGAQKSLGESEKLEPYIGADLLVGFGKAGGLLESTTTVTDATLAGGTNGDFTTVENKFGKTTTIGILPTLGFNYYFAENFAVGAEFAWGFKYSKSGTDETTVTDKVGAVTTTTTTTGGAEVKSGEFGSYGLGRITVSVFF